MKLVEDESIPWLDQVEEIDGLNGERSGPVAKGERYKTKG